jgi:hypothetical protein
MFQPSEDPASSDTGGAGEGGREDESWLQQQARRRWSGVPGRWRYEGRFYGGNLFEFQAPGLTEAAQLAGEIGRVVSIKETYEDEQPDPPGEVPGREGEHLILSDVGLGGLLDAAYPESKERTESLIARLMRATEGIEGKPLELILRPANPSSTTRGDE